MEYPVLKAGKDWFQSATKTRPDFNVIRVVDRYTPTGAETESWAADEYGNGSIRCYVVGSELIIAGNGSGKISLNANSSYVFSAETPTADNIPTFKNVTHIFGADRLDTSKVTDFSRSFAYAMKLEYIDVSSWDVSNVTTMEYMFGAASSVGQMAIKDLDVSGWNVGSVKIFKNAFLGCASLEILDTRNWNMEAVESIYSMFRYCSSLKRIYSENWVTPNLQETKQAFEGCSQVKELNLKGLNNRGATVSNSKAGTFKGMLKLEKLTLGKNYTFMGDGGRPDNPSSKYIDGADDKWHTLRGESFDRLEMPDGVQRTYYASQALVDQVLATPVVVSGAVAAEIAAAVREKTGTDDDVSLADAAAVLRGEAVT